MEFILRNIPGKIHQTTERKIWWTFSSDGHGLEIPRLSSHLDCYTEFWLNAILPRSRLIDSTGRVSAWNWNVVCSPWIRHFNNAIFGRIQPKTFHSIGILHTFFTSHVKKENSTILQK